LSAGTTDGVEEQIELDEDETTVFLFFLFGLVIAELEEIKRSRKSVKVKL
jgi:hypothetical protein